MSPIVLENIIHMNSARPPFSGWIRSSNTITQQFLSIGGQPDIASLTGGLPAAKLYPVEAIRQAADRVLKRLGTRILQYAPNEYGADHRNALIHANKLIT